MERRSTVARIKLCSTHTTASPANTRESERKRSKCSEEEKNLHCMSTLLLIEKSLKAVKGTLQLVCSHYYVSVTCKFTYTLLFPIFIHPRPIHPCLVPSHVHGASAALTAVSQHSFPHIDPHNVQTNTSQKHTQVFASNLPLALLCFTQFTHQRLGPI